MYTKIYISGHELELYQYDKSPAPRAPSRKKSKVSPFTGTLRIRRWDNANKTRKAFRRLVFANVVQGRPPALLTLTMLHVAPLSDSYPKIKEFFRRLRVKGIVERYIAVPEFQKRGAVHFHVLVWGKITEYVSKERHTRTLQNIWGYGYVDIIQTDGSPKLASYLSKYMSKTVSDNRLAGQKAFSTSSKVLRPVSYNTQTAIDYIRSEFSLGVENLPLHVRQFSTEWLGTCTYKKYVIQTNEKPT